MGSQVSEVMGGGTYKLSPNRWMGNLENRNFSTGKLVLNQYTVCCSFSDRSVLKSEDSARRHEVGTSQCIK